MWFLIEPMFATLQVLHQLVTQNGKSKSRDQVHQGELKDSISLVMLSVFPCVIIPLTAFH